jgi:hypothetical protein
MLTMTLASFVVATVASFIAWRSIRREHLRADARVASLAAAIDSAPDLQHAPSDDLGFADGLEFQSEGTLLTEATHVTEATHTPAPHPLLTMGIGACAVVAVVVLIAMTGDRVDPPTQPIVSPHAESLELLSLRARRDGSSLAVTGLVRSRSEEPLAAVTAVVSAVDAKGRPIGRGSVTLTALMPRRESRFAVTIPEMSEAARYHVSFRSATHVIRHVDRRAERAGNVS